MRDESEEELTDRVRSFLVTKSHHLSSMSNARRALLALYDYASSVGITLTGFSASVGLTSAFLSSQAAPTMAASRLQGLKWAQLNYSLQLCADSPSLKSFSESRSSGANHATTMPIPIVCHLAVIEPTHRESSVTVSVTEGHYIYDLAL